MVDTEARETQTDLMSSESTIQIEASTQCDKVKAESSENSTQSDINEMHERGIQTPVQINEFQRAAEEKESQTDSDEPYTIRIKNVSVQIGVTNTINKETKEPERTVWLQWIKKERIRSDRLEKEKSELLGRCQELVTERELNKATEKERNKLQGTLCDIQRDVKQLITQQGAQEGVRGSASTCGTLRNTNRQFSISLECPDSITLPELTQFPSVVTTLYADYQVRLLGVAPGPVFIMDTPEAQWSELQHNRAAIQSVLERLLPEQPPSDTHWGLPTQDDIDLKMERLNVARRLKQNRSSFVKFREVTHPSTHDAIHVETLMDHPMKRVSSSDVAIQAIGAMIGFDPAQKQPLQRVNLIIKMNSDPNPPRVSCIVSSASEDLFLVDIFNTAIKCYSLQMNSIISHVQLTEEPYRLTVINDKRLAVTIKNKRRITFIEVKEGNKMSISHSTQTKRLYGGICALTSEPDDPKLIVSSVKNDHLSPCVDLISLDSELLRTIVDGNLGSPDYLHLDTQRHLLYISDISDHCVICYELIEGKLLSHFRDQRMINPRQLCTDFDGNLYVACKGLGKAGNVLVKNVHGEISVWQNEAEHGSESPLGICMINKTCNLVVSWEGRSNQTVKYSFL